MVLFVGVFIKSFSVFLCVALGVGFYTLMERKVLSYIQIRKGPNKVGFMGLVQPLVDAVKLFSKENPSINLSSKFMYMLSPVAGVLVMFMLWSLYTSSFSVVVMNLGVLFFLAVSSLNVYVVLLSGWSSNSKYSLLGGIRAMAQTVSYEVSMALVIMSVLMMSMSFEFLVIFKSQFYLWFMIVLFPVFIMWMVTSLAETNRAPFDLAEGESELVSGFNVEYGSGEFALLFIAEYGSILLMSMLSACLFMGGFMEGLGFVLILKVLLVAFSFLWVRGSYPRVRYDVLMSLTWKVFLLGILVICCVLLPVSV